MSQFYCSCNPGLNVDLQTFWLTSDDKRHTCIRENLSNLTNQRQMPWLIITDRNKHMFKHCNNISTTICVSIITTTTTTTMNKDAVCSEYWWLHIRLSDIYRKQIDRKTPEVGTISNYFKLINTQPLENTNNSMTSKSNHCINVYTLHTIFFDFLFYTYFFMRF